MKQTLLPTLVVVLLLNGMIGFCQEKCYQLKIDFGNGATVENTKQKDIRHVIINCTVYNCSPIPLNIDTLGYFDLADVDPHFFYFAINKDEKPYPYGTAHADRQEDPIDGPSHAVTIKQGESYTYRIQPFSRLLSIDEKGNYDIIWMLNLTTSNESMKNFHLHSNKITLKVE